MVLLDNCYSLDVGEGREIAKGEAMSTTGKTFHYILAYCPTPKVAENWQNGFYMGREVYCPGHDVTVQEARRIIVKEAPGVQS